MGGKRKKGYLLSLDGGTGTVRVALFSTGGELVREEKKPRAYEPDPALPGGFFQVFNPDGFWSDVCTLIRAVLHGSGARPEQILAVSAAGQRFSYVFLGEGGQVLYAGPNLDGRGIFAQGLIEEKLGPDYTRMTGQWPPLLSALARLLWFRQEAPAVFSRIRTVMMFADWMLYKLCGEVHTEATAASASGLLDVASRDWSEEIRAAFDLDASILPPILAAGETVGHVSARAGKDTGLKPGTPVVVAGADTQCALLGAGLKEATQIGIVAGTSAPLCALMDSPFVDPGRRSWTSCHMGAGQWILEANTPWAGYTLQWLRDLVHGVTESGCLADDAYGWIERAASQAPPGAHQVLGFVGPAIMGEATFVRVRPAVFHFPPPSHPTTESPARAGDFLRAVLENIAFTLRANQELILEARPFEPSQIHVTGGLARSQLFCRIVSDCMNLPVLVPRVKEGSALGAAICAAAGVGLFSGLTEAQEALVRHEPRIEPNPDDAADYATAYQRWREIDAKLESLDT